MPSGARISEFEILHVLGSGGFGIVYLAHDTSLQRRVALKEYLPAALAGRKPDGQIAVRSELFAETFSAGLRSFINESRLLAKFDHPSLVKVHRFWEANGTAYMVMPFYEGVTLKQVRQSMTAPPEEAWLRRVLDALLGALDVMHAASVYHRDIAPDNILLLRSGAPVLLDFGAARHVLAEQTQTITAMLKPAYAPIEQYADALEFRQGPWTDIYAAAATLHYCLTGKAPLTAIARTVHESYEPLHQRADLRDPPEGQPYDAQWLAALDWALEVKPQARPQSIAQWREALDGKAPVPRAVSATGPIISAAARVAATPEFYATALTPQEYFPTTVAAALRRIPAANAPQPSLFASRPPLPGSGKSNVSALAAPLAPFASRLQGAAGLQSADEAVPDDESALRLADSALAPSRSDAAASESRAGRSAVQRMVAPPDPDKTGTADSPEEASGHGGELPGSAASPDGVPDLTPLQRARRVLGAAASRALAGTQGVGRHAAPRISLAARRAALGVERAAQTLAQRALHAGNSVASGVQRAALSAACETRGAARWITPFAGAFSQGAGRLRDSAHRLAARRFRNAATRRPWHWTGAAVVAAVTVGVATKLMAPAAPEAMRGPILTAQVLPPPEQAFEGSPAPRADASSSRADASSAAPGSGAGAPGVPGTLPPVTATHGDGSAPAATAGGPRPVLSDGAPGASPSGPSTEGSRIAASTADGDARQAGTEADAVGGSTGEAAGTTPTPATRSGAAPGDGAARGSGSAGDAGRKATAAAKAPAQARRSTTAADRQRGTGDRSGTRSASTKKASASKIAGSNPRQVCQDRFLLGWFSCMRDACESKRWERHAQCVEWHRMEQERVLR